MKSSQIVSKSCQKVAKPSFCINRDLLENYSNINKMIGLLWSDNCCQEFSKSPNLVTLLLSSSANPHNSFLLTRSVTRLGEILLVFGKKLTVYFLYSKMLSQLWQICDIIGLFFIVTNGQILKNIQFDHTAVSHSLAHYCCCALALIRFRRSVRIDAERSWHVGRSTLLNVRPIWKIKTMWAM